MLVMKPENENEESRGTEGARRATGVAREAAGRNGDNPDPEVTNKAIRRRFSAAYKRRVVREADRCTESIPFLVETLYGSRLIRPPSSSISSTSSPQSSTRA